MTIDKRRIAKSLLNKGFTKTVSHHTYFHHIADGKETGAYTYLSHGGPKDYGDSLLKPMRIQLRLETIRQVRDLFMCPLSAREYATIVARQA